MSDNKNDVADIKNKIANRKYSRTFNGIIRKLYWHQILRSQKKQWPLPTYTFEQLRDWINKHKKFKKLYDKWRNKGFVRGDIPTIDRIKEGYPYEINNIQVLTQRDNAGKSAKYRWAHGIFRKIVIIKCSICNNKHYAKGYCEKHFDRFKKWGTPFLVKIQNGPLIERIDNENK